MTRALVLLSGGIDSAVALAWAHRTYDEVLAITFHYHLRPFRERLGVLRLLQAFPARLIEIPADFLREAADHKMAASAKVPEGYVSNRNLIFYSIAAHFAEVHGCVSIIGGHIGGDGDAFPDASVSFMNRLQELTNDALLVTRIKIELPLAGMRKSEVLVKAMEWKVPLEHTWSCYWDRPAPCGSCVSCVERGQAFEGAGLIDPVH